MNILIIEDDRFFAEHLCRVFQGNKLVHRVDRVESFEEFLIVFSVLEGYDMILTDIRLTNDTHSSDFDGFQVIRTIRATGSDIPIVVISSRDEISQMQYAFELGADDYLVKGIRLKELEIRVMHWFRYYYFSRIQKQQENIYTYKILSYDMNQHEFFVENTLIPLTKSMKHVLRIFMLHAEKLLSENYLVSKIWGDHTYDIHRNIRIKVLRLRQSLLPFGICHWVRTIHGQGYIFSDSEKGL